MWRKRPELKDSYDVVIVGGGSHGLATAYYLQKEHGITDVAILEKNYIGSGAAGPETPAPPPNYQKARGGPLPYPPREASRGPALLRPQREALRGPVAGPQLQPAFLAVRPPDARALRPRDVRDGEPGRGQPPRRHRLAPDPPRRDQATRAGDGRLRRRDVS